MILFIVFIVLHFTGKLRFSNQAVMLVTALFGTFFAACDILVICFIDIPVQFRILIGIAAAAVYVIPIAWQNIFPADEYSFRRLPPSDEREAVGIRRLLVSGLVSTAAVTGITAVLGSIIFISRFASNVISTVTVVHALVTLLSLGSGFGLFLGSALVNLTAGAALLTVETLLGYVKGFYDIILVLTYIYLVNGLVRYIIAYKDTWQDRIVLLVLSVIPNVNIVLGIILAVKTGKRLKALRAPVPDVINVSAGTVSEPVVQAPEINANESTEERNLTE